LQSTRKKLLSFWCDLGQEDQHALLRYAEFLSHSRKPAMTEVADAVFVSPTENESVIGALKRLSAMYPMLDSAKMLDQTSNLVSEHVLRGRAKEDIISEFELLFDAQYQKLKRAPKFND